MVLELFHPLIQRWFENRFGVPTDPQRLGWPAIAAGEPTLIAAPTGSGKTLSAFLVCIDRLLREALEGELPDTTRVVYISPLKALSNDIQRNLEGPLEEILAMAHEAYPHASLGAIRAQVRTGDTPSHVRAAMLKRPPHILVTTPESLYLLLTSAKSREKLARVETVIVDEIHALVRDKRGSHLALTLERLDAVCEKPPVRIGLSATQKPLEEIARFLVGTRNADPLRCRIIDAGHLRTLDLGIEVPASEPAAVCSNEQWDTVYARLLELIASHRSTLIFVNTRRMAERISYRLSEHLGSEAVGSHHGSLSRDMRLSTEARFKRGELKVVVATASLELGIDIGFIDLVCQIGSPRSIATFLQRVGRSGHRLGVIPKGRLFALTRDELLEAMALVRAVKAGRLDAAEPPIAPLDILAQQLIAEVAAEPQSEDALFKIVKGAWPYRDLTRADFDRIVTLTSEGIAAGRHDGAYLHRDGVHHELKPRRSARLTALTSGGAIPETADYRVVTEGEGTFVGTVNEDFAIESLAGDVFLLGNTSWRIRYVRGGQVVVNDAEGAPATIPFWLGEAPGRTVELSEEVSRLREEIANAVDAVSPSAIAAGLVESCGVNPATALFVVTYVAAQKAAIGFVPTQQKILFERFFDDSGGMQLVIHAPYGSRINRAWGLALRKRFCRTFDFELQASADDNGIVLSLGPQHSFPIEQLFTMLNRKNGRDTLVQALLAAPMFQVRWRWNISRALAVLRVRGGKKVPPPLQRFKSDDLLTAVFPLQTACFEHRPPEVPLPDHPLIFQTVFDCLHEAMDIDRWERLLDDIQTGRVELIGRDTREPSPFSHSILNANAYAFLDDAPLEERRARAVALRRTLSVEDMRDLARLDPEAIARVESEAWPLVRDADELHDMLLNTLAFPESDARDWTVYFETLVSDGRATRLLRSGAPTLWTVAERAAAARALFPNAAIEPALFLPPDLEATVDPGEALTRLVRGRMEIQGPTTAATLATLYGIEEASVNTALVRLEAEGAVLQGRFTERAIGDPKGPAEWCERRLLARIHRLTLEGARKRVQPVPPETYWRFLIDYHHVPTGQRRDGPLGLHEAVAQLQGFELPSGSWELDVLPERVEKYQPEWLDQLSYSGELTWGRLRPPQRPEEAEPSTGGLTRVVPISLAFRDDLPWLLPSDPREPNARPDAAAVLEALKRHGALFFQDIVQVTGLLPARVEEALGELAALGAVTADGFRAIRGLMHSRYAQRQRSRASRTASRAPRAGGGRWTVFPGVVTPLESEARLQAWAAQLLRRYGVVFRDLVTRETVAPSWWQLVPIYRRMEARGEIRGGRFVAQVAGEQYAIPEAIELLRRTPEPQTAWTVISAADPLNLAGIITAGQRIPATRGNRLLLHNGRVAAIRQAGEIRFFEDFSLPVQEKIARLLELQLLPVREALLKELAEAVTAD